MTIIYHTVLYLYFILGAVVGVLIYRPEFASNHYRKPHIIAIGYLLFAAASAAYLWFSLARENKRKERLVRDRKDDGLGAVDEDEEERLRLGDRRVNHRYIM